jgi:uncharacterized protein
MNVVLASEIDQKRERLAQLCRRYDVAWLAIFGSGTRDDWNPHTSDLDFLVRFQRDSEPGIADRYLGLAEGLERLFGRSVDLVTDDSIENPYFRQAVDASRTQLYAA